LADGRDECGAVQVTLATFGVLTLAALIGPAIGQAQPRAPQREAAPRARAAAPARIEHAVPFKPGETLAFDISWSEYLTAASATVTVREKRPSFDSAAYYIVAEGQPTGLLAAIYSVYYKVDTLLDAYTLLPQRGSVFSQEGRRRRMQVTRFDQAKRKAVYEVTTATVVRHDLSLPTPAHDPLSALYVLRTLPMRQGSETTMAVVNEGEVYQLKVTVTARETIATPLGALAAWKLTPRVFDAHGKPSEHELTIWVSDDARRLPLRIDANLTVGRFSLVLREARGY
jgi:hypothetical protein